MSWYKNRNWYKKAQQNTYEGFKVVGFNPITQQFYSIYDRSIYNVFIGQDFINPKGIYLGSSKEFCTNYYICGTKDEHDEYILTFSYNDKDLIRGEPNHSSSEVLVSRATITQMEKINKEEWC